MTEAQAEDAGAGGPPGPRTQGDPGSPGPAHRTERVAVTGHASSPGERLP